MGENMKTYKCMENKRVFTETQLRNIYYIKIRMGYTGTYNEWVTEEMLSRRLVYLNDVEATREFIRMYNRGK